MELRHDEWTEKISTLVMIEVDRAKNRESFQPASKARCPVQPFLPSIITSARVNMRFATVVSV